MEPEARTARRALWVFRLIFYPAAALIAAIALGASFDGGADEPEAWHGRTSQGRPVTLSFLGGRPDVLTTSVLVTCPDGDSYVDEMRVYARSSDGAFEMSRMVDAPLRPRLGGPGELRPARTRRRRLDEGPGVGRPAARRAGPAVPVRIRHGHVHRAALALSA